VSVPSFDAKRQPRAAPGLNPESGLDAGGEASCYEISADADVRDRADNNGYAQAAARPKIFSASPATQAAVAMSTPSSTHLVLIPSYNPGAKVDETVRSARAQWSPVWVVVDGSTDGSAERLQAMARRDPGLHVIVLPANRGKGGAVLAGIEAAAARGFTHVLTMDSDGQHPAALIPEFMAASEAAPEAMVLGLPKFDASAPQLRVQGRRVSNFFADLKRCGPALAIRFTAFACTPSRRSRRSCGGKRGCAASTSILKPPCGCAGPACGRFASKRPCAISAPMKAAFRISITRATTCCLGGCICGSLAGLCCGCRG
jgi:hypothetical protein